MINSIKKVLTINNLGFSCWLTVAVIPLNRNIKAKLCDLCSLDPLGVISR